VCAQVARVGTEGDELQPVGEFYISEPRQYCQPLVEAMAPVYIIPHGSVARGRFILRNDLGVLVIAGDLPLLFLERIQVLMRLNETRAPIEPLGCTTDEFTDMPERRHVTALDALSFGIPLYGSVYFEELPRIVDRMPTQGLRHSKCTWTVSER
jgi:predicted nucleotidyltransferase